jgi:hypothetical protein
MPKTIPLTRGMEAIVDSKYYPALTAMGKWQYNPKGYAQKRVRRNGRWTTLQMHQAVCELAGIQIAQHIDHRDLDGLNNRRRNLRPATIAQNRQNVRRRSHNRSGFKGVSWKATNRNWVAQIRLDGKPKHLGSFDSPIDAARIYDRAAKRLYGRFARLNFPRR